MICLDAATRLRALGASAPATLLSERAAAMKPYGLNPKAAASSVSPRLAEIHQWLARLVSAPGLHRLLDIAMATVVSVDLSIAEGTPLVWLLAPAAPSTGKTETVLSLHGYSKAKFVDTLTPEAFATAYKDKDKKKGKSLLDELDDKCLVIKDLTTIFSLQDYKVKKLLGDLATIHDGMFSKASAVETEGSSSTDHVSRFSLIACVTPAALKKHHNYMSTIGAKFLVVHLPPLTPAERLAGFALSRDPKKREYATELRANVQAHLDDVISKRAVVRVTPAQDKALEVMSELIAQGRTLVNWVPVYGEDGKKFERIIGDTEGPIRAYQQLRTLLRALAMVRGHSEPTVEDVDDMRSVALASVAPDRAAVLELLCASPVRRGVERGLTAPACAEGLRIPERTATARLDDLVSVRLLVVSGDVQGEGAGRPAAFYAPAPRFNALLSGGISA
jgi:hypothetical protein